MPVSDFAWDNVNEDDAGLAAIGFNLGLEYLYPLSENGFGLFGGIDFLYNGLQGDAKDKTTTISIDYYALGIHDIDGTITMNTNQDIIDGRQKVDVVTITVGVEL